MATISIDEADHASLCKLAETTGQSIDTLLHDAIVRLRRDALLKANNAAFERLMQDPAAYQDYLDEQKAWDATLADGLEDC